MIVLKKNSDTLPPYIWFTQVHACDNCGLTISIKKTEVTFQPTPGNQNNAPSIKIKNQPLTVMDTFTYLWRTLPGTIHIVVEADARIVNYGRPNKKVWDCKGVSLICRQTQGLQSCSSHYPTLQLRDVDHLSKTHVIVKKLNRFHLYCLYKLLNMRWQDKIPDTEVLGIAEIHSIHTLLHTTNYDEQAMMYGWQI